MKPPRDPVCKTPQTFPETILNRPGLDRIAYRVGTYGNARRWLLEQIDQDPTLAAWTYRGADDPGIALYESASLLVDILTLYQEAYANEAYLRTATWRESVADLVRLLGYRLKPAIAGTATFAFEVKGKAPITIPSGYAVKADLVEDPQSANFQTSEQITALPWLSRFALERPQTPLWIVPGTKRLVVDAGPAFASGDRIAIGVSSGSGLSPWEIVIVDSVETWHGRSVLTLKGAITKITGTHVSLAAVKLDQTFHHVGHNAPAQRIVVTSTGTAEPHWVTYDRAVTDDAFIGDDDTAGSPALATTQLPLDPQTTDLALGSRLAIQVVTMEPSSWWPGVLQPVVLDGITRVRQLAPMATMATMATYWRWTPVHRLELATIVDSQQVTMSYGALSAPATIVTLAGRVAPDAADQAYFDIRTMQIDSIVGEPFTVGGVWIDTFVAHGAVLAWWGDAAHAKDLRGRTIGIAPAGADSYTATVLDVVATPLADLSMIVLDRQVAYADFEAGAATLVFGNLAGATEGKQEAQAVLGNGDDRATFQSFQVPKQPLTYLDRPALTPPQRPELQIVVDGRIWSFVPTLYGSAPDAEVYIVRQDNAGNSWVQFGDGKTGARLPSGVDNVRIRWRTGAGAYGRLKPGSTVTADRSIQEITGAALVGIVVGGSAAEDATTAKLAAPSRVQSLDRIVSVADVEAEALAIGGVAKARASLAVVDGLPAVQLILLMQPGRFADLDNARKIMATANRQRGPQRFPIDVVAGELEYVYLDLSVAIDPTYDPGPVRDAVAAALGVGGLVGVDGATGLFGERSARSFGDAEYATRIEGVAQNVPGVQWALVNALCSLGTADDPSTLAVPANPARAETVACASTHVLRLDHAGLVVRSVPGAP